MDIHLNKTTVRIQHSKNLPEYLLGRYSKTTHCIKINNKQSKKKFKKVLYHELAHSIIHLSELKSKDKCLKLTLEQLNNNEKFIDILGNLLLQLNNNNNIAKIKRFINANNHYNI